MKITYENFRTPGQFISALLLDRGWSGRVLATVLGIDETGANRLIQDKRAVTAELAIALEEVFGTPANDFLELQKNFDLAKARITTIPNPQRATRAKLFGDLPISEMIKRGWLNVESSKDIKQIEVELARLFKVEDVQEIEKLPHAAKKTNSNDDVSPIQLAWLYRVKEIASNLLVTEYSESKLKSAIPKLKNLLAAPEEARNVPKILAECGIRFIIVEALKSSKIDGVCFWLDEQSPVIGMSLRFDRMDNFWFVLRHEIEHVLQKHGQENPVIDVETGVSSDGKAQDIDDEEWLANTAASEFCVPKAKIESFIARKAPLFPTRDFLAFSKIVGVHPCLVAGQIQFKTNRHELFRNYLVKIRPHVLQSAIVDGWGDVFPIENKEWL